MKLTNIAVRNIKRNKKRSILSIIATGIATYAIVFMFAFIAGLEKDMEDVAFHYTTGEVLIRHKEFDEKSFSLFRAVDSYQDVLSIVREEFPDVDVSPRIKFPSIIIEDGGDKTYSSFGIAVDFESERKFLTLDEKVIEGEIPNGPREVLMGQGLAKELGLKVGDKFTPNTSTRLGASTGITFKVVGLGQFSDSVFNNKSFLVSLEQLPMMLKMEGSVSEILIKGIGDVNQESFKERANTLFSDNGFSDIEALTWKEIGIAYSIVRIADLMYTIIAFFFFALASSVIANTMLMVVFERRKEIGTITAMGMTSSEVIRLFFLEAAILGAIGAGAGVILGTVMVIPLSYIGLDLSSFAAGIEMGTSWNIFPQLSIKSTLVVFLYSTFVASFISFFPSRGAAKVDPVVALRAE